MRIHYISVHEVLEFDEVKLLTDMGHQVFSNGAYLQPVGHPDLRRPGIPGMVYNPSLENIARTTPRTSLPPELIDPFDVIIIMHEPNILDQNWKRIKHKRVIWRSIGQSNPAIERMIKPMMAEGLEVVRYSPMESHLPDYAGESAMIRFYKDPNDYRDWNGNTKQVINLSQSLKGRRGHCHYDEITAVIEQCGGKVYGSGNEDLGHLNGGKLTYNDLLQTLRDARCFIYGGTWPAAYTLAFMEAWMTGIPIVAFDANIAENINAVAKPDRFPFYEVDSLIQNGETGFVAKSVKEAVNICNQLLSDYELAKRISDTSRHAAIGVFGIDGIRQQWNKLLNKE